MKGFFDEEQTEIIRVYQYEVRHRIALRGWHGNEFGALEFLAKEMSKHITLMMALRDDVYGDTASCQWLSIPERGAPLWGVEVVLDGVFYRATFDRFANCIPVERRHHLFPGHDAAQRTIVGLRRTVSVTNMHIADLDYWSGGGRWNYLATLARWVFTTIHTDHAGTPPEDKSS